jgi:hypothetical protein
MHSPKWVCPPSLPDRAPAQRLRRCVGGDPAKVNEIVSAMKPDAHGHILFVEFEKW